MRYFEKILTTVVIAAFISGLVLLVKQSNSESDDKTNSEKPVATKEYELTQGGNVNLTLLDVNGKLLKHLLAGQQQKGIHAVQLNASDLSPGMYLLGLKLDNTISYHKIIIEN